MWASIWSVFGTVFHQDSPNCSYFEFPPLNRFLLRSFCCDNWPGWWSNQNLEIVRLTILSFFLTDLILTCGHLLKFYWDLLIHILFWTLGLIKLQKICRPIRRVYIIKKTLQDIFSSNLNLRLRGQINSRILFRVYESLDGLYWVSICNCPGWCTFCHLKNSWNQPNLTVF